MSIEADYEVAGPVDERLERIDQSIEERLRPYGVRPDEVERERLVVEGEEEYDLTAETAPSVHELRPGSLSEMTEWIGVDDESAPAVTPERVPPRVPGLEELEGAMGSSEATAEDPRDSLNLALSNHLYCDSRTCRTPRGVLERAVELSEFVIPFVPMEVVHVKSGNRLNVGSNVSVLFADLVRIENGGAIRYDGGMKIDTWFFDGVP